ncbi:ABC transporter permease [Kitasatospora sp. NPDC058170]|uniref:ABC transporter permease n=1 Tax=Kitasatospora sp. NPDC058170 TaxID=3346364 RepID=UPI0036D77E0A
MIWLTWRQFRTQLLVTAAGLSAVAVYLLISGFQLHDAYSSALADCPGGGCSPMSQLTTRYSVPYYLGSGLVLLVPGLIGAFWGAPLIARELETGTHRLIWNQSITRTRWLTVKLLVIGLAAVTTTGLLSLLVSWLAGPLDRINNNRFNALLFGARGIVPLGYAVFAVALGTCVGLLIRRSVPAMAATLAVFAAVQVLVPLAVRPHLESPVRGDVALTSEAMKSASLIGFTNRTPTAPFVADLNVPGAWVLSGAEPVRTSSGQALTMATQPCAKVSDAATHDACLADADLHVTVTYQPADRYWAFQWYETAIFLALTAGLTGFSAWWLRRRLA